MLKWPVVVWRRNLRAALVGVLVAVLGLVMAQQVAASTNLVGNPGFETGTSGWNTNGGASGISLTQATGGHSGSYSAKLTNTNATAATCLLNDSPNWVRATSAGQYTGTVWVRADTAGASLNLRFREYSTSGSLLGTNATTVTLTTSWQQVTVTRSVSSPGSTLDFNAYVSKAAPGTCFYADDVTIYNGTADAPPTASLQVTPSSGIAPLQISADASGSTDTDATPISTYKFDFGDGTVVGPQTGATASHIFSGPGTFTVTVTVTDTGGLSSTASRSVNATSSSGAQVLTYAGYYDTHHAQTQPKPSPWQGSPNVIFQGVPDTSKGGWDSSAVRVDNVSGVSLPLVSVVVDIGSHRYALWHTTSLGAGQTLIVAQTGYENFDGSDTNAAGCYGCDATLCTSSVSTTIPVVQVTVDGVTTSYPDRTQLLNTQGVDRAGCPDSSTRNDESEAWQQLSAASP